MSSRSSRLSEHTIRRRVLFYEVDSAGIVHFSNYFRYMEEAEHALWRAAGLSIARSAAGVGYPRVAATFEYHRPLRFEDEVDVRIRIVGMSEKTMRYECDLRREGEAIATGRLTIVCVSTDPSGGMKAIPLPAEVTGRFAVSGEAGAG